MSNHPSLTRSSVLGYVSPTAATVLSPAAQQALEIQVIQAVNAEIGAQLLTLDNTTLDAPTRARLAETIRRTLTRLARERELALSPALEDQIGQQVLHKLIGYGFLETLLPPHRETSEVMVNQDGSVWIVPKGESVPQRVPGLAPSPTEVQTIVGKILSAANRRATEAEPVVAAKLPRSARLPAGARGNVGGPPVANGPYPIVNIRLYEETPVRPEKLIQWGAVSPPLFDFLVAAIRRHLRVMIAGGTASGKTTLLSALANFIPPDERILLVEDPSEIFLDHPHVVSMETRPPSIEGKYGVSLGNLVTTAMRQTPKWLIVGEVRTGDAAVWLFRAQMSDHPGLSTIHAYSPQAAVHTLGLLAGIDLKIDRRDIKELITQAIDLFVQIEPVEGVRRVTRVTQVAPELQRGDVWLDDVWRFDRATQTWNQIQELTRRRV